MESGHQPELWQNFTSYWVRPQQHSSDCYSSPHRFIWTRSNNPILRTRAYHNMGYLLIAFVNAVLILIPQPTHMLGTALAAVNFFGIGIHLNIAKTFLRHPKDYARGGGKFGRWIIFFVGFLLGLVGSGAVLIGQLYWAIYLVATSCLVLLVMTVLNAWSIMVGVVGRLEKTPKTKRGIARHFR